MLLKTIRAYLLRHVPLICQPLALLRTSTLIQRGLHIVLRQNRTQVLLTIVCLNATVKPQNIFICCLQKKKLQNQSTVCDYISLQCRLRRPVGRMTVDEQRYEGEFRYVNSRLITNSEEVAFYQGNKRERRNIYHAFNKLVSTLLY